MNGTPLRSLEIDAEWPQQPEDTDRASERFRTALAAGRFEVLACRRCGRLTLPPATICPVCRGVDFEWKALGTRGSIFSVTRVHGEQGTSGPTSPYDLGLIDLDAGLRLRSRLLFRSTVRPAIGDRVHLVVARCRNGATLAAMEVDDHPSPFTPTSKEPRWAEARAAAAELRDRLR